VPALPVLRDPNNYHQLTPLLPGCQLKPLPVISEDIAIETSDEHRALLSRACAWCLWCEDNDHLLSVPLDEVCCRSLSHTYTLPIFLASEDINFRGRTDNANDICTMLKWLYAKFNECRITFGDGETYGQMYSVRNQFDQRFVQFFFSSLFHSKTHLIL